ITTGAAAPFEGSTPHPRNFRELGDEAARSSVLESSAVIGTTVGSYRIQDKLGEGGMGAVYLAEHTLIGRRAAVKVLLPELSNNQEIVNRFFNEARSTAQIKHPGLIDIYDFGYHTNGSAFIVMEFLEGESLAARLRRETKLPVALIANIGRQIASALA